MSEQKELEIGIGTIEPERQTLEAKKVKIVNVEVVDVEKAKSKKIQCEAKHPDKEETIRISSVAYLQEKKVVNKGLWFNLDKEGNIQKGSSLAVLLDKTDSKTIKELIGKELDTDLDGNFLCFKCY